MLTLKMSDICFSLNLNKKKRSVRVNAHFIILVQCAEKELVYFMQNF